MDFSTNQVILKGSQDARWNRTTFQAKGEAFEKQRYFQSVKNHTHLKGPFDKVTSLAVPGAMAAASLFMIGRGIYNMSHGIGKKE